MKTDTVNELIAAMRREANLAALDDALLAKGIDALATTAGLLVAERDALRDSFQEAEFIASETVNKLADERDALRAQIDSIRQVFEMQCPPHREDFAADEFGRGAWTAHNWWNVVLGGRLVEVE